MIGFTYKGQEYQLPDWASRTGRPVMVVLDKNTVVIIMSWRVQPDGIQEMPIKTPAGNVEELRNKFAADFIAEKVLDKPRRPSPSQEWTETIGKMLVDNGFGDL